MKRLKKKASQTFIHATGIDRLESILDQGLIPGQETGNFSPDSLMNGEGVYVSSSDIKGERLQQIDDFGSVLLELSLDTNNMIPDPEYFNTSGPHSLSNRDIRVIMEFIVDSDLFQTSYSQNYNIDEYEDLEEFVDNESNEISKDLFTNNYELAKLLSPGTFNELSDYVYLGSISPSNIVKIYISDNSGQIHEFNPNERDQISQVIEEN